MLARIRKAMEDKDQGFTLIELLVVMIIIGILAAIAIPVFLSQRAKAQDAAAKADVSTLGKEIATYFVDGDGTPTIAISGGHYFLTATAGTTSAAIAAPGNDLGKVSSGVYLVTQTIGTPKDSTWCVSVKNDKGDKAKTTGFKYSAAGGLDLTGTC